MRIRTFLIGTVGVVLAVVGIGAFLVSRLDLNDYVGVVETRAKEATGRELKIEGKVGLQLSLLPTVAVEGIRFGNAAWGSRPGMATVKRAEVQIALLPLLTGEVAIRRVTLVEPDVLLEVNARGAKNWEFAPAQRAVQPAPAPEKGKGGLPVAIGKIVIENGAIAYVEAKPKRELRAAIERLAVETEGRGNAVEIDGKAVVNGVPVELKGSLDELLSFGTPGAAGNLDLKASATGAKVAASGKVPLGGGSLEGLDLKAAVEVTDWASIGKLARASPPRLPALKAEARARTKQGVLEVEELKATLGRSSATGSARIGLEGKRRDLAVRLDAPFVDLAELAGPRKPAAESRKSGDGRVFPADPFPLETLKALDGKAQLKVAKLALPDGRTLQGLEVTASFNNGRIVADPAKLAVEGKELRARITADASTGKTLALDLSLNGSGIPLGALAGLAGQTAKIEGAPTDLAIRLSGTGASARSLMAGASGEVRIVVGAGRLPTRALDYGADITQLLDAINPARKTDPYTELKCAVIRFPVKQGVARIDNGIGAETNKVNVIAAGTVDLRTEALDLGFRPKAATGLGMGLGNLAGLARLGGTLGEPKVQVDAAATASTVGKAGLAFMTGGLSAVAGGLLLSDAPDNPCQIALTGAAGGKRAAPAEKKDKGQAESGGFPNPFKGLFGK